MPPEAIGRIATKSREAKGRVSPAPSIRLPDGLRSAQSFIMEHFSSMTLTAFLWERAKLNTIRLGCRAGNFRGRPAQRQRKIGRADAAPPRRGQCRAAR